MMVIGISKWGEKTAYKKTITLPISIVVELYNSTPMGSHVRDELLDFIKFYKKTDKKGHVCEGFFITDNGNLSFNEELYKEAIYRGKVETYTRLANKSIEELRSSLGMLKDMGEKHIGYESVLDSSLVQSRIGIGEPINLEQKALLEKLSPILLKNPSSNE